MIPPLALSLRLYPKVVEPRNYLLLSVTWKCLTQNWPR